MVVPVALNLNDLVIELDSMLRRLIGEDVELATVTSPDLGIVKTDAGQIDQVLMNLVVNARDAMSNGGRLTIETINTTVEGGFIRLYSGLRPGGYVVPAVSDTGIGMTQDVQEHMFEQSYITKTVGEGTGLGLPTCYGIVRQSGGHIAVDSRLGEGTSFRIFLPRVDEEPSFAPRRDEERFWPRGDETILLVEDEPLVGRCPSKCLRGKGTLFYKPSTAPRPCESLRAGRTNRLTCFSLTSLCRWWAAGSWLTSSGRYTLKPKLSICQVTPGICQNRRRIY